MTSIESLQNYFYSKSCQSLILFLMKEKETGRKWVYVHYLDF